jgi:hypothetical protein
MLDKLLATAANNAKLALAAAAGAALVAGGSAVAFQQVADSTATDTAAVSTSASPDALLSSSVSDTSTATIPPKPSKSPKAESGGAQGVHGACVSAVARDKTTVGRDHGKAVSEAAHSCPKGGDDAEADTDAADTDADDDDADDEAKPAKPAKPAKGERGRSAQHKPSSD